MFAEKSCTGMDTTIKDMLSNVILKLECLQNQVDQCTYLSGMGYYPGYVWPWEAYEEANFQGFAFPPDTAVDQEMEELNKNDVASQQLPTGPECSAALEDAQAPMPFGLKYVNWQPGSHNQWYSTQGSVSELQGEAALVIQKCFRGYSRNRLQRNYCVACGGDYDEDSDSADTCDKCGKPVHVACMQTLHHPVEPYSVCPLCACRAQKTSSDSVVGGERECSASTQESNVSGAPSIGACNSKANDGLEEEASHVFAPLDQCLDYTMQFLEGGHVKSNMISEQVRAEILQKVKATLQWKKEVRSGSDVGAKVHEINDMMMGIVSKLSSTCE